MTELLPPPAVGQEPPAVAAFEITSEMFARIAEQGLIPADRRVFLWGGRLYEKMAKSKAHAAVQNAFWRALERRLPPGMFAGAENPVRLDATHLPLADLVVARGAPLDYFDTRYPDGGDILCVVEVAVSSLPEDLGNRLARYAQTLPSAVYVVVDVPHRAVLVHTGPRLDGTYADVVVVRAGETIKLRLAGVDLAPIPWEEVLR